MDAINSRPIKIGNLSANSLLWYRKYIYLNCSSAALEIKTEKQLKVSAYLCKVGVETIVWKEIKATSINSAANYHENQFFQRNH